MNPQHEAETISQRLASIHEAYPNLTIVDPCEVCAKPILGFPRVRFLNGWAHLGCMSEYVEI